MNKLTERTASLQFLYLMERRPFWAALAEDVSEALADE